MSKSKKNGALRLYRSYMFREKDPIVDRLRTIVQDSNQSYASIEADSGVSQSTLRNWFHGTTKRPQFCTIAAVVRALGHTIEIRQKGK